MISKEKYLEARIGLLESTISQLIQAELATLQPHSSTRWHLLNTIHQNALEQADSIDRQYAASKEPT